MRPGTLLRTASVLALVQFAAHGGLFVSYRPHAGTEATVVDAMRSSAFRFGLVPHSYWDLYFGYGLMAASNCLVEAVLFWQLARIADRAGAAVAPIAWLFSAANLVYAGLVWRYFAFVPPLTFDVALAALLGWAAVLLGKSGAVSADAAVPRSGATGQFAD